MIYDVLSRNTVKITLTENDMREYQLKSECLRTRSAETKRAMTRFLRRLRNERAIFPDKQAERLFLEAFPSDDGGCVVYVSTLGMEPMPPEETPVRDIMCAADSFDSAVRLCAGLDAMRQGRSSSLYRLNGTYCIILRTDAGSSDTAERLFCEYGEFSDDETDIAYVLEHGTPVCSGNAVRLIAGLR